MPYKWIIFDADGTLFDYDAAEFNALKNAFASFNLPFSTDYLNLYQQFNKVLWDEFERGNISIPLLKTKRFELLLNKLDMKIDPEVFSTVYLDQLSQRHDLIEGATELLEHLYEKFRLVLMTNGIKEVQRSRLKLSPLNDFFSEIIISDEVGVAKPDKQIFEIAHKRMSSPAKKRILIVGDNLSSDIKGGLDFGIDTCWYNPDQKERNPEIQATFEIKNLNEIIKIVQ